VHRQRQGRTSPRPPLPLLDVEGPPFGPVVEELTRHHEAAALADQLPRLVVPDQILAPALGAGGLSQIAGHEGFAHVLYRHLSVEGHRFITRLKELHFKDMNPRSMI